MRRILTIIAVCIIAAAVGLFVTRPQVVDADAFAALTPDPARGAQMFIAMGCGSCHAAPDVDDRTVLPGGQRFVTTFGTFVAPNISSDVTHGIGAWSDLDLANAVMKGTSPTGQHYFPAFPYPSYARGDLQDVADLAAYMRSLPADPTPSQPHDIGFPFNLRILVGGWKFLYLDQNWVIPDTVATTEVLQRGRTLVEAWGHCAECHTPRNALGGPDITRWLAGGPNPSGDGQIPGITPAELGWTANDIAAYLQSGFTPDFDTAGGEMVAVIANTSRLTPEDRDAIAAYLLALPE